MKKIAYLTILLIDIYAAFSAYDSITAIKYVVALIIAIAFNMLFDHLNSRSNSF